MGDIADMMLEGSLCQYCGEYLGNGEGYATLCGSCSSNLPASSSSLSTKEQSRTKRASNTQYSTQLLIDSGVSFQSKNNGAHLIVQGEFSRIDFWPATGKFVELGGDHGRGVRNLLKLCKIKQQSETLGE